MMWLQPYSPYRKPKENLHELLRENKNNIENWLKIPTRRRKISKWVENVRRDRRQTLVRSQII